VTEWKNAYSNAPYCRWFETLNPEREMSSGQTSGRCLGSRFYGKIFLVSLMAT